MSDSAIQNMVKDSAPRLFALVEEEDGEAWVEAWGMVLDDHTEVVSVEGDYRMSLEEPENALWIFNAGGGNAQLVWA
ncbi:hypothetical protein FHS29_002652 [Saccharothrix tamanrassetensis]|uniref:Uncharacterized protein n=1 Tax=Saccharothrix tamanrassetensis TaxID=1051531 RepID=A0A841CKB7_9PSEU|nr:hypothetical protein [Saccharothrix tamanrassetensis]MBB5956066.1 hypothetical protein [Saccharothrix tamanrassetensis]